MIIETLLNSLLLVLLPINQVQLIHTNLGEIDTIDTINAYNNEMEQYYPSTEETIYSFDLVNNICDSETINLSRYEKHANVLDDSLNEQDILEGEQLTREIIGNDDRVLVDNPKSAFDIKIGYLRDTMHNVYNNVTQQYVSLTWTGTCFLVGPNLVLTAGHCLYKDATKTNSNTGDTTWEDNIYNPRNVDEIHIYFGANGSSDINNNYQYYARGVKFYIEDAYYNNTQFANDWALIELDRNIGNQIGWFDLKENWYIENGTLSSKGYPGDKPTATMWETTGQFTGRNENEYFNNLDTAPGQSGSPYFVVDNNDYFVCGIHTLGSSTNNGGKIINNLIYRFVDSFFHYHNYLHQAAEIIPTDYGFADNYPTDNYTSSNYRSHTLNTGFHFQTRRYRTGYIHNEYIVMSSIRRNIQSAFIEYKFDNPVLMIQVDLAHWRPVDNEILNCNNGTAVIRYNPDPNDPYDFITLMNMLSSNPTSTILPTDRTNPNEYTIVFPKPTYTFQFYTDNNMANVNDSNRGRICIGDLKVYTLDGI